jgi:hypothetical protein
MTIKVFFSWQADTETRGGRNLIERALERAAARISADTEIEEAARDIAVDRDTKDVPGSPPIVDTIFRKIDEASVARIERSEIRVIVCHGALSSKFSSWRDVFRHGNAL